MTEDFLIEEVTPSSDSLCNQDRRKTVIDDAEDGSTFSSEDRIKNTGKNTE